MRVLLKPSLELMPLICWGGTQAPSHPTATAPRGPLNPSWCPSHPRVAVGGPEARFVLRGPQSPPRLLALEASSTHRSAELTCSSRITAPRLQMAGVGLDLRCFRKLARL